MFVHRRTRQEQVHQGEVREELAAVRIQACWRGRRERRYTQRRRCRYRPWGYFTHTLVLTYAGGSAHQSSSSEWTARSLRRKVYLLLEVPGSSSSALALAIAIVSMIVLSVGVFVMETVPEVYLSNPGLWAFLEVLLTAVFTLEYLLRLAVCGEAGLSQLRFIATPMNLFDLLAVLPFYLEMAMGSAGFRNMFMLRVIRLVRLVRLARIFKLGRYASGMRLMGEALASSKHAMSVLFFLLCMGAVLFSSMLFHLERLSCPVREDMSPKELLQYAQECADSFNGGFSPNHGLCCTEDSAPVDFPSIIATMWWAMATMTSVGYGDIYPKTTQGRFVAVAAMLVGMVLIALPVAIIGQKFQDIYQLQDWEEARYRAAQRRRANGRVWSLIPASDVLHKLKNLHLRDRELEACLAEFSSGLEDIWQNRERLNRERCFELERQGAFEVKAAKLFDGMRVSVRGVPSSRACSPRVATPQQLVAVPQQ